jgi:glycosyltransferase involved in cell wall biosynthesis
MASAVPVVTSSAGSIPEIVGQAACIVNPESAQSIAEGLLAVLNDQSYRSEMVDAGLQRAKLFIWQRTVDETARVYNEAISGA